MREEATISPKSNRKEGAFVFRWLFTTGAVAAASFASAICISEREEETAPPPSSHPPSSSTRLDSENRKVKTNFGGRAMQECT